MTEQWTEFCSNFRTCDFENADVGLRLSILIANWDKNTKKPLPVIIFHDPACVEYSSPGHPERPERITRTVPLLKDRHPTWQWQEPRAATNDELLRAHSREHVEHIKNP